MEIVYKRIEIKGLPKGNAGMFTQQTGWIEQLTFNIYHTPRGSKELIHVGKDYHTVYMYTESNNINLHGVCVCMCV